jgi:hypothetical protein
MLFVMPEVFRPSTSLMPRCFKDVDARDKPGHDESDGIDCRNNTAAIGMNRNAAGSQP